MRLLFNVIVDDNAGDYLGDIYQILGLRPKVQHDQYELIQQLHEKLLECGISQELFTSFRSQGNRCTRGHVFARDEGWNNELQLNFNQNEKEVTMQRLVSRQLLYTDDTFCPTCLQENKRVNLIRETNPNVTTYPDFLVVIVARYFICINLEQN